jgi:hypothetical protein
MFKQLTISDIKQSVSNITQNKTIFKMRSIFKWIFIKAMLALSLLLTLFGLVFIFGMFAGLLGFNPMLMTNNAVVFYRSNLPSKLTAKESKQVSELNVLKAKLNKDSKAYSNRIALLHKKTNVTKITTKK